MNILVIIAAYNRPDSLSRLLGSMGVLPSQFKLVVSIDGNGDEQIQGIAKQFNAEIIQQPKRLGLKEHILFCINEGLKYDAVVVLEDDLYLANTWTSYIETSLYFYSAHPDIAAISLYNQAYHPLTEFPFTPIDNGSDVWMARYPSSSGFMMTQAQAKNFIEWMKHHSPIESYCLPQAIKKWPAHSWKKWMAAYLSDSKKYIIYPRISLSTNYGDIGKNHQRHSTHFQSALALAKNNWKYISVEDSVARYDEWLEYIPFDSDISFNIYGQKSRTDIHTKYTVIDYILPQALQSFGKDLKPPEMNYIRQTNGKELWLVETIYISEDTTPKNMLVKKWADYFYIITSARVWWKYIINKIFERLN